ncbi:MAG: Gfo/Idh/MocA family oxidoreductase [Clostridiales bacterium]|nr:Gfo/Idh/MocA family oxidoreductase [Clostridiales bacterium]
MKPIRIGMIGCGWFGNRHLDYLLTREDVKITALATANKEKLMRTAEKAPGVACFENGADLIASGLADAVFICIPPNAHGNLEQLAAEKGVHLYVEKPVGVEKNRVLMNLSAIEKSGIICAVGYQERFDAGIKRLKGALSPQDICMMEGAWIGDMPAVKWWRCKESSGGQVVEQSTHIADMMRFLAGEAESVMGMAGRYPGGDYTVEDHSAALIRFKSGAIAALSTGCFGETEAVHEVGLRLYGKDFSARICWGESLDYKGADGQWRFQREGSNHDRSVDAFLQAVKENNPALVGADYREGAKSFLLTLAIEEAFKTGGLIRLDAGFRL